MKRVLTRTAATLAAAGLVLAVSAGVANARPTDWWLHTNHVTQAPATVSTTGQ